MPRLRDERGAFTIFAALCLPLVFIGFAFAVDVANWFIHKRHLQLKADAAAFAGASAWMFPGCDSVAVKAAVDSYSGVTGPTDRYNLSEDAINVPSSNIHQVFNGSNYHNQSIPNDTDLAGSPDPCASGMVDVKMTEGNVPFFFRAAGFSWINAQARIQLNQVTGMAGLTAIGVEETSPKKIRATFFNEDTGAELGSVDLARRGRAGSLEMWDNAAGAPDTAPISIAGDHERVGVRIALGGGTSTTCGDPLVLCYGKNAADSPPATISAARSLAWVRNWSPAPTTAPTTFEPMVGAVKLTPGAGCLAGRDDGWFHASCTQVRVTATIRGGVLTTTQMNGIKATIGGASGTLSLVGGSTTEVSGTVNVTRGAGAQDVALEVTSGTLGGVTCRSNNQNPAGCKAARVHRTYAASEATAGPLGKVEVLSSASAVIDNNVERCGATAGCTRDYVVSVGIAGRNDLAAPTDPPILLRIGGQNQNGSLQCDPAYGGANGFEEMVARGCAPQFRVNTGSPNCAATTKAALFGSPQPWACVPLKVGNIQQQAARGLNRRTQCGPPNESNCSNNGSASQCLHPNQYPAVAQGDPRAVPVFLVPFGSFDGSGMETVPVVGFATFYVTGYVASGGVNVPCAGQGDTYAPNGGTESGAVSGHFVKYVIPNDSVITDGPCNASALSPCVAVMTR